MPSSKYAKALVAEAFTKPFTNSVWSSNYTKVLPMRLREWKMSAVLPAMFYLFRFGHRRGKGKFTPTYGGTAGSVSDNRHEAKIDKIAGILAKTDGLEGFDDETSSAKQAILGDLLLCYSLENVNRKPGRSEQVQRATAAHYMTSWIDLPDSSGHLAGVPEMLVAMLSEQTSGFLKTDSDDSETIFPIGKRIGENVLMKPFYQGMDITGHPVSSDRFSEETEQIGIDQLLMIRLAQHLGSAPSKPPGTKDSEIPNQRPIARIAAHQCADDLSHFIKNYGDIPRQTFVELLETGFSIGLTTIVSNTVNILNSWMVDGEITPDNEQSSIPIFVDCSSGADRQLRQQAEDSMDDVIRRSDNIPKILMAMRILDHMATYDPNVPESDILQKSPDATDWLNLLGDILHGRNPASQFISHYIDVNSAILSDIVKSEYEDAAAILSDKLVEPNPILRLAEALTSLQGKSSTTHAYTKLWDSSLMTEQPNGIAKKRKKSVRSKNTRSGRTTKDARSVVFTDSALEYLVHLHVLRPGRSSNVRPKSFESFIIELQDRHGLFVDEAPHSAPIPNELLQRNRSVLERRLRDLGLLEGVNDAEAMKSIKPRFTASEGR